MPKDQSNLPKNSMTLIIRHAEQPPPPSGPGLSPAGRERALAYVNYFKSFSPDGLAPVPRGINHIFAAANSPESCRPQLTILPTAAALDLPIYDRIADKAYKELASAIGAEKAYDNSTLLICWHHEHALKLAHALIGATPTSPTWPPTWPGGPEPSTPNVYGWMLIIVSKPDGSLDNSRTKCINTRLMPHDKGQEPPSGR